MCVCVRPRAKGEVGRKSSEDALEWENLERVKTGVSAAGSTAGWVGGTLKAWREAGWTAAGPCVFAGGGSLTPCDCKRWVGGVARSS